MEEHDPRVFFAAERTLLAWARTGIAVMGLGFLVARFSLFLHVIRKHEAPFSPSISSSLLGCGLALMASFMVAAAAVQHARFTSSLGESQKPPRYMMSLATYFAGLIALAGLLLTGYLLVSLLAG
jgi:putative membrane protein